MIAMVRETHSANHVVYAYDISTENATRFSDDGEPKGTAGMPVYEIFRREGLTCYCCTVTRYFGGILPVSYTHLRHARDIVAHRPVDILPERGLNILHGHHIGACPVELVERGDHAVGFDLLAFLQTSIRIPL